MKTQIIKMDHNGNGIGFINNKVIFVPKTIVGDEVEVKVIKETKTFLNGKVEKYLKRSDDYVKPFCPHYDKCDGCQLQNMTYDNTLKYKKERCQNILRTTDDIKIINNKNDKYYRNKIELKVKNGKIGYFFKKTHELIEIFSCPIAKKSINDFIRMLPTFNIKNGSIIIRSNFNDELLIIFKTKDKITINEELLPNYKVVGIILNDECVYGENHFLDKINNMFFNVSYDAFFQVNSYINNQLFSIINKHAKGNNILDLYSGVGTLAIMASNSANKVYGIEYNKNAIKDALINAKMNKCHNISFILGNVEDKIKYISDNIDTVIVDPPRRGIDDVTIKSINSMKPNSIIYISCDTHSLKRDLQKLSDYQVNKIYLLDMFSYTFHVECVCLLERR